MNAKEHPDYGEEKQHLDETLNFIEEQLNRDQVRHGSDPWSTIVLTRMFREQTEKLREVRQQPYSIRVDWLPEDGPGRETFYFGKQLVQGADRTYVYSWASDWAGELYFEGSSKREAGQRLLKRTFQIQRGQLEIITDEYVHDSLAERLTVARHTDQLLSRLLRTSRGRKLQDIVATIQAQQYDIITLPKEPMVVVQGVSGSGKTSIALHRVAYLLYHHREARDFAADNLLILGPSRIFLGYIANVLPSLGEHRIPQKSFDAWMIDRLDTPVDYEPQDASLELLLDPTVPLAEKAMRYRNARNKGSIKMAQLLKSYVEILHHAVLDGQAPLVCTYRAPGAGTLRVERTLEDLRRVMDKVADRPFNARRAAAEQRLTQVIAREIEAKLPTEQRGGGLGVFQRIQERVEDQVHQYFEGWHKLNVSRAYRRLLRTHRLLQQAGAGLFSPWDLELMRQDAPTASRPFRFSDLAALLYLKILLDGVNRHPYDHIVIDEAQDITPLQFKVLSQYSRDLSMTVLGDLAQGIYPHHGVQDWQELDAAVGDHEILQKNILQSYRSTQEIIDYANNMLARIGVAQDQLAQPFRRSESKPEHHPFSDRQALVASLPKIVQDAHDRGHNSIAIVCKTLTACRALDAALGETRSFDYQLIDDRDTQYQGRTAIIPSYLTKGLEFDAVIVADAETYAPHELDANLLYVVLTRALHALHVCWTGDTPSLLDEHLTTVEIQRPLSDRLVPRPVVIETCVSQHTDLDADWCVERLASADKLWLLQDGKIDETVLAVLIRSFIEDSSASVEPAVLSVDAATQEALEAYVADLTNAADVETQRALAFTQLAYGLLRNPMRRVGLQTPSDDGSLSNQIILLVTLFQAVQVEDVTLRVGPRTTRRRALQAVEGPQREFAQQQLSLLIDFGIVEEASGKQRDWIHVPQTWLYGLLALGLGHVPEDWDQDLLNQIVRLPEPLDWQALAEVE